MAKETLGTDINGRVDFSLPVPASCYDVVLTENTVETITTPPNFNRAFFSYAVGTNVWVTLDGTDPEVPSSNKASTQELNPAVRQLDFNGGESIKFISDAASFVNIRFDLGA
jgi:hypothetical protein